jgi:hypothetical protein
MGEWAPDEEVSAQGDCTSYCRAMLWIIPAKVQGTWQMPGGELALTQTFQNLSGTLKSSGSATPISNGKMRGEEISFTAGGKTYNGRVTGTKMEGTISGGGKWQAARR